MTTTTQRGYGAAHQRMRAEIASTVDAGRAWCTEPVCLEPDRWIEPGTPWHLVHDHATGEVLGPGHQRCNLAEKNRRHHGAQRRRFPPGSRYRTCEVCSEAYRANYQSQRTCSRACGIELRRRNAPPRTKAQPEPREITCSECGKKFTTSHGKKMTCSQRCSDERLRTTMRERYRTSTRAGAVALARIGKVRTSDGWR